MALLGFALVAAAASAAQDAGKVETPKPYVQKQDLVYAEIHGTGLLMDLFTPTGKRNGLGMVDVASGAWSSDRGKIRDHERAQMYNIYCGKGYTVFAIRPGSRSKYTGLEMVANVRTAIRYVKTHASEFGINPDRLGLTGASAGAHLASLAALTPEAADSNAKDPLRKVDTTVKAVGVFFPPTNFLDWNGAPVPTAQFQELFFGDRTPRTPEEIAARARELSPALHAKAPMPPFLVIHGDADKMVPLQQSKMLVDAIHAAGGTAELIIKPGGGHPWLTIPEEVKIMSDWFDKKLNEPQ